MALDLAQAVYEVTKTFPREEQFGMTSQMQGGDLDCRQYCGGRCQKRFT